MHFNPLLVRAGCLQCPSIPPVCDCAPSLTCIQIAQSCTQCSTFQCVTQVPSPSSSHGISAGVVAGAIVGALIFLSIPITLLLWWRRRNAVPVQPTETEAKDIPAPADTVLNRPDPTDKITVVPGSVPTEPVVRVYANSNSTINLDPSPRPSLPRTSSSHSNPFGDSHSIQTTSTSSQSFNVIPIAFVPPPASVLPTGSGASMAPLRPQGAPLNIDHMNFSSDSVPVNPVMADDRSYITNASYASDILSEVPKIVTGRQLVSTAKAAVVIPTTPGGTPSSSRPSTHSPLSATPFGPQDVLHEVDEGLSIPSDPFADERSPALRSSMATRGSSPAQDSDPMPTQNPWNADPDVNDPDRPLSTYTQAASIISANIMDATRVHLGFVHQTDASVPPGPGSPTGSSHLGTGPVTLVRVASGRVVAPFSPSAASRLERQQESALANEVQRPEKAQANPYRMSMSTMASGVSGRADSILESFTFVPPSPISNRPIRTPPRSPLAQETHNVSYQPAPAQDDSDLQPPNRQILGMSTGSQLSAMSTGLGSFPFQIDHGSSSPVDESPVGVPPRVKPGDTGKQRASLDTLALTKDLASYPLGFDRQSKESFSAFMASKK
ncbi:hypothetical protein BGW80DRAFT_1437353 [Lactifluus volemus]|nr:hypothetical protein BGW80DRAFT_1437353 [Lactifluus volemus]